MNESDSERILERLERFERRLDELSERISRLEGVPEAPVAPPPPPREVGEVWKAPQPVEPPPVIRFDLDPYVPAAPADWSEPKPEPRPETKAARESGGLDDLEYKIGMTGMLRGGAVVVVLAILFLVALGITRGWITLPMQFAGELALCAAFIVIGFWKRNEREEFGQLMTGVGSCGLYMSFAGAHVYKELISGETLVGAFVALSLANLGYALWRSSRWFLAIGMIGGLVASVLPMREGKVVLDIALHLLILVPTALIVIRRRWQEMAALMWLASGIALLPAYFSGSPAWVATLTGVYASAILGLFAYSATYREPEPEMAPYDASCLLLPVMALAGAVAGVALDGAVHGSLHVLVLAAACAALAVRTKPEAPRAMLWSCAGGVAVIFSPMGFARVEAAFTYGVLSVVSAIGLSLAAGSERPKVGLAASSLSWMAFALSLGAYTQFWVTQPGRFGPEIPFLCLAMVAASASAWASWKAGAAAERATLAASVLILPLFARLGYTLLAPAGMSVELALLAAFLVYSVVLFGLGAKTKWASTLVLAWVVLLLAMAAYQPIALGAALARGPESGVVGVLVAATLFAGWATHRRTQREDFDFLVGGCGVLIGLFAIRLSILNLGPPHGSLTLTAAITVGLLAVAFLANAVAMGTGWRAAAILAWPGALLGSICAFVIGDISEPGLDLELPLLVASHLAVLASGYVSWRRIGSANANLMAGVSGAVASFLLVRLAYVVLVAPGVGVSPASAAAAGFLVVSIAASSLAYAARWPSMSIIGVLGALAAAGLSFLVPDLGEPGAKLEVLLLVASHAALVFAGFAGARFTQEKAALLALCAFTLWGLFSRLMTVVLVAPPVDMKPAAALTLAWIVYAVVLMGVGFWWSQRILRYGSLALFGLTLGKVMLLDLRNLDPGIRVVILLALGLAMIGGGYWYIRLRSQEGMRG